MRTKISLVTVICLTLGLSDSIFVFACGESGASR